MNCLNYDCNETLEDHLPNDCGEEFQGGSNGLVLLECNHQLTDPSSATQINAEIAAGRAKLVRNIKLGINAPSSVSIESNIGCESTKVVTYDRSGTLIDGNVNSQNIDFYNTVFAGRRFGGMIFHECGTEESADGARVTWIDKVLSFTGGRVFPSANTEFQRFEGTFNWRSKIEGQIYPAPTGIF